MSAQTRYEAIDDCFPEFFRRLARPMDLEASLPADIRLDVNENDKEYLISAEVPGAKKDDIRVEIDGNILTISTRARTWRTRAPTARAR